MEEQRVISKEEIEKFIEGHDPMEHIVNLSYKYNDSKMIIYYRNDKDEKCKTTENFYPFLWATLSACQRLCEGNKTELINLMNKYKIGVKKLSNVDINGIERHEFDNGYMFLFFAKVPMAYSTFLNFFKAARNPVYGKRDANGNEIPRPASIAKQYLTVTPAEQFMISTGKRFFKGYDDYDQICRMTFDLETEGLDPYKNRINQIGIRTNKGFEHILSIEGKTEEEKNANELKAIDMMMRAIYQFRPDVITAHNGENFDWNFLIVRCDVLGKPMSKVSAPYFENGEYIKKEQRSSILKLGGEIEKYYPTIVPNIIVTDSLHAVRRAQAIDSNMLKADLKYVTKYLNKNKGNRVYVPGEKISTIWNDKEHDYAFNDNDGKWYVINDENPLQEGYEKVTGKYIVERYLKDDLWECDKVEYQLNTTNFLICKMLPVPYKKCTTMGTAGQWKSLMLAWSYENNLAIPMLGESKSFTGGLSRLLQVGYVKNVAKFDYNSLYPSIILTWGVSDTTDLMNIMLKLLEYMLTSREKFKGLKKAAKKRSNNCKKLLADPNLSKDERLKIEREKAEADGDESFNDKKQLQNKIFCNSYFGSYGAPNVFPWGSLKCAEQTTCIGRMALRLMISYFKNLGYAPIVGDSFTEDTPLFIKYKATGLINIVPISELINESEIEKDALGREYDYSEKNYQVLCRSGWCDVKYIYRHKTDKDIYKISEGNMKVEITEDHSLFNENKVKIKPSEINKDTKLEYYTKSLNEAKNDVYGHLVGIDDKQFFMKQNAKYIANGVMDRVPMNILNANSKIQAYFLKEFDKIKQDDTKYSKTCLAGILYLRNNVEKDKN